jgi:hypothetical protein
MSKKTLLPFIKDFYTKNEMWVARYYIRSSYDKKINGKRTISLWKSKNGWGLSSHWHSSQPSLNVYDNVDRGFKVNEDDIVVDEDSFNIKIANGRYYDSLDAVIDALNLKSNTGFRF